MILVNLQPLYADELAGKNYRNHAIFQVEIGAQARIREFLHDQLDSQGKAWITFHPSGTCSKDQLCCLML